MATPIVPLISLDHPSVARQVRQKQRLQDVDQSTTRRHHNETGDATTSLPAGNHPVNRWIVLDLGLKPPSQYLEKEWSLEICYNDQSLTLTRQDLTKIRMSLTQEETVWTTHWNCVTGWTAMDLSFEGIPLQTLFDYPPMRDLLPSNEKGWQWLYCESADGYTVPIHRDDLLVSDDTPPHQRPMLALECNGKPIPLLEHGGPRLLLPSLFGWKSGKWVVRWTFLSHYKPGFWETLGCHQRGRHAIGERFDVKYQGIWKWLAAAPGLYRLAFGNRVWIGVMQLGGRILGFIVHYFIPSLHSITGANWQRAVK